MELKILKEHIKERLEGKKVKAAVFHTFNFDPVFFENYVMPLFVPSKDFSDEKIYNKILWRICQKEGLIPEITVYCDFYVKNNAQAPSLGYEVRCIRVPAQENAITNFHPKHIFLLTEDSAHKQSLLVIIGSGNLTPGGWCENFECFSISDIQQNKTQPNRVTTNPLQDLISNSAKLYNNFPEEGLSSSETLIFDFLNKVTLNEKNQINLYTSFNGPFANFLEKNIFKNDTIQKIEITSPYFSEHTALIDFFKTKGNPEIRILIPELKNNEVFLKKETFVRYTQNGVLWSRWGNAILARTLRNNHSKIYRLYGSKKTYTVLGSLNFTSPAWTGYTEKANTSNIESAILFKENGGTELLSLVAESTFSNLQFKEKQELEANYYELLKSRKTPDISFEINWELRKLRYKTKALANPCIFQNIASGTPIKNKGEILLSELSRTDLKKLSKNPLIEIQEKIKEGTTYLHYYYPRQLNIENKPFELTLSASAILQYWKWLNKEEGSPAIDKMIRALAEAVTDQSGFEHEEKISQVSYLNEIAGHFNALIELERHLFDLCKNNEEWLKKLKYYLLAENIDTVPNYYSELQQQLGEKKIQKSLFWVISQILINQIYEKAIKQIRSRENEEWINLKYKLRQKKSELKKQADQLAPEITNESRKLEWVISEIKKNHESIH